MADPDEVGPTVIYLGRCYETYFKPGVGEVAGCYDLRTGEIYYEIPTADGGITPQVITYWRDVVDVSVPGATESNPIQPILVAVDDGGDPTTLYHINPYTGEVTDDYDLTNDNGDGPGRIIAFKKGYMLSLRDSGNSEVRAYMEDNYWDGTDITLKNGFPTYLANWTTAPEIDDFADRVVSNITFALAPSYRGSAWPESARWRFYGQANAMDMDAGVTGVTRRFFDNAVWGGSALGVSLITGEVLWERFFENAPYSPRTTVAEDGVFVIAFNQGEMVGLDIRTGAIKWTNTDNSYPFGGFWGYDEGAAYGNSYWWGYDGIQAFNLQTGETEWHYNHVAPPFETTYFGAGGEEGYSFNGDGLIADGKIFTTNSEHSETTPYTRGWSGHVLDANTGELIWKIAGAMEFKAASDGYITASNYYDGYMYVFGKGESAITVSAPPTAVAKGTGMIITGTVLDVSPAQAGTPCVSVDSMDTQMNYLHMQRPIDGLYNDETITGVPVMLTAIGSDGSYIDIGTTTSSGYYGSFGIEWTPTTEGTYEIQANFLGSDAYGSSGASTWVAVGPELTPTTPIEPEPTETPLITTEVAIIAAIAIASIIGVATFWVLKKRK